MVKIPVHDPFIPTLIDGVSESRISVFDRSVHYGDGVFETVAVHAGVPLLWERHLQRLRAGCRLLGLAVQDTDVLRAEIDLLCRDRERAVVKIIISRGCGGRGYAPPVGTKPVRIVSVWPWPEHPVRYARLGVKVRWCGTPASINPQLAGIKHLNRLEQVLARAEWDREFAEGLMCDPSGYVVEGTMSNVFGVSDGVLVTPDLSQAGVAGVMRAEVIAAAQTLGLRCTERRITAAEFERMDEVFLTNSIIGLWPVVALEDSRYDIGAISRLLQEAVRDAQCFEVGGDT